MSDPNNTNSDWELSQDYYREDNTKKEWKLEDFIEEGGQTSVPTISPLETDLLQKTIQDVKQVMKLASEGNPIPDIARKLNLDEQYVFDIQITAQGFHEDDEVAVAHLMMMG